MAAIDKIYVDNYDQYLEFKDWCDKQPPLTDKYGKKARLMNYVYDYDKPFEGSHPVFMGPYYVDAYLIRNCPFDFIQKELMVNYGYWSQERIRDYYEDVKNWSGEGECPYWAKLDDFVLHDDGTIELKGVEESDYQQIKDGKLFTKPSTDIEYEVGKHFRCTKHPKEMFNRPFKRKRWDVDIKTPEDYNWMWYHDDTNTWDFSDEFVISKSCCSWSNVKTIKALKRLIIKWKLPVGTIISVTGKYRFDDYEFIVTK